MRVYSTKRWTALKCNLAAFKQGGNILSIVLVLPPAPAALVLLGRALASLSFWSAAALLRIAVFGPPGGVGEEGLPVLCPATTPGEFTGDDGRGEDCESIDISAYWYERILLDCETCS
jgi:hypothetical protein